MNISLSGLQDIQRKIEVMHQAFSSGNIQKAINLELEHLRDRIEQRIGTSLRPYLKIDPATLTLHLVYEMSGGVTARDYHNPASKRFNMTKEGQPFQDVLADEGYDDISPARGAGIQVSHGTAPDVKISAKMGPRAIERMKRHMGLL